MEMGWKGAALALLVAGAGMAMAQTAPQVRVAQGLLQGVRDRDTNSFRNIPFAAPPAGALRFAPPASPIAWSGTRDASQFGPACMQQATKAMGPWSDEFFAAPPFSEDCLTLNVWTTGGSGKAILLFVPGGGFTQGGGNLSIYNGAAMAKADVVAVTMNYRLGAAGFLAHPGLTAESPRHSSGNQALWDVVAALRWIRANAAAFGGDPTRITIMGQSAGAQAIIALLHAPEARGLFRGAIIDSGLRAGGATPPLARAEEAGAAWARTRGATTLAELRALPAQALVPANGDPRQATTIDGALLSANPDPAAPVIDVPILTGWNGGEGTGSGPQQALSTADYERLLGNMTPQEPKALLALYPAGANTIAALRAAGHDATMMSAATWLAARTARVRSPIYFFDFQHVMPGYTASDWGSYHSSELPYIFGTLDDLKGRSYSAADRKVAATLQAYWLNFIKTGNPNGNNMPAWRAFEAGRSEVMALGETPHMRPVVSAEKAAVWQRHYARMLAP